MHPPEVLPPENEVFEFDDFVASDEIRAEMGRRHLVDFIQFCKPDYVAERYQHEVCAVMERFYERVRKRESPRVIIVAPPQSGKALALDTPIPTPSGWSKLGDIKKGDLVFAADGSPTRVIALSPIWTGRECFSVETDTGFSVVADADHEWVVRLDRKHKAVTTRTTDYLAARHKTMRDFRAPAVAPHSGLQLPDKSLPIAPYTLGVWLGDGTSSCATVAKETADKEHILSRIREDGFQIRSRNGGAVHLVLGLHVLLKANNLLDNKHIPACYLRGSRAQRLALLQGLIDTDGHVGEDGSIEFSTKYKHLGYEVHEIVASLGLKCSVRESDATLYGKLCGKRYRLVFKFSEAASLPRKRRCCMDLTRKSEHYLTVAKARSVPTRCIQVAHPSGMFLAGRAMLPTHNSSIVSRYAPAWFFGRFVKDMQDGKYLDEEQEFSGLFSTYNESWASELCRDVEKIMDTPEYAACFVDHHDEETEFVDMPGARISPPGGSKDGKRTSDFFELIGYAARYKVVGRGQPPAGRPGNFLIIDDFLKGAEEALSETVREACWRSYAEDLNSRLQRGAGVCLMATRWNLDDLIGRALADAKERNELHLWEVYVYPAIGPFEPFVEINSIGSSGNQVAGKIQNLAFSDEWLAAGESLTPIRFPAEEWLKKMGPCNPAQRAALYYGSPIALTGNIFPADMWKYYGGPGQPEFPDLRQFDSIVGSWDLSFKDKTTSDFISGQIWGWRGAECWLFPKGYLLELAGYPRTKQAIREMQYAHPYVHFTFVEDAANGPAIIADLKGEIPGLIAVSPEGGKIARAWNASALLMAGNCYLPDPSIAPHIGPFVQRCRVFPANINKAGSDDDIDAFTQMAAQRKRYQFGLIESWKEQAAEQGRAGGIVIEPAEGENPEDFARRVQQEQSRIQMALAVQNGAAGGFARFGMSPPPEAPSRTAPSGADGLSPRVDGVSDKPKCKQCGSTGMSMTQGYARCACGWEGRL